MAQDRTIKEFSRFIRGINTELSLLDFPDDFSADEENFELLLDGSRRRRQGIQTETGGAEVQTSYGNSSHRMQFYKWENADNSPNNVIGVVQVGTELWFMDMTQTAPSANLLNSSAALTIPGSHAAPGPLIEFAEANGMLMMVGSTLNETYYLSYNSSTSAVTINTVTIQVRDQWGIDDGLEVDEQPSVLSDEHDYNLHNQGWTNSTITAWDTARTDFPSNADIVYLGKDSTGAFNPTLIVGSFFGNTPAPKGKAILNFFDRGASRNGFYSPPVYNDDEETGRFSAVASNFGRVFYGGVESSITQPEDTSPNASNMIFYSQVVQNANQLGRCYTEQDPTAESLNDILDTDGGWISIPDMGKVYRMVALNNQIIVLAKNGIWAIVAPDGFFSPTNYTVIKVTEVGALGPENATLVEGTLLYWSENGIYQLTTNEISQQPQVADITIETIKTLYNTISTTAKSLSKGLYDPINKKIHFLYNDESNWDSTNFPDHTNMELIFDLKTSAFTKYRRAVKSVASPYTVGFALGENSVTTSTSEDVEVNAVQVTVNGVDVTVDTSNTVRTTSELKYLTFIPGTGGNAKFTLSAYQNSSFLDWDTENYDSYFLTGHISLGDFARDKGVPYMVAHFKRTETGFDASDNALNPSSCMVQPRWEWNNTATGNRWASAFEAYRYARPYIPTGTSDTYDTGAETIITRSRIRGRGQSIQFRMYSTQGKDLHLYGFALVAVGGTAVR